MEQQIILVLEVEGIIILIFKRDGPAFQLDSELTKGITHDSYTY